MSKLQEKLAALRKLTEGSKAEGVAMPLSGDHRAETKLGEDQPLSSFEALIDGYRGFEAALKDIRMSLAAAREQFDLGAGKGPVAEVEGIAAAVLAKFGDLTEGDANFDARMFLSKNFGTCLGYLRGISNDLTTALSRWSDMDERLRKELERILKYADDGGEELLLQASKEAPAYSPKAEAHR
ncbi:MAG: hypothetical protein HW375_2291 [Anaerolineales bacterium]|nr:hypothetical protein [Anaerolineales bacterium]